MPSPVRSSASCSSPPARRGAGRLYQEPAGLSGGQSMTALYHLNENIAHLLEGFSGIGSPPHRGAGGGHRPVHHRDEPCQGHLPLCADAFFRDRYDFHHEMSTGLTTALEFSCRQRSPRPSFCRTSSRSSRWRRLRAARSDEPAAPCRNAGRPHRGKMMPTKVFFAHSFPVCAERQK